MPDEPRTCRLYLITPERFVLEHFTGQLKQAFDGGDIATVQLRMKQAKEEDILKAAKTLMPVCHEHQAAFIINDHPELVVKAGADGVHLGMDDMSVAEARAIVGNDRVVGVSCYGSRDRAMQAGEQGADYVAFGQFYATRTKPPRGRPMPEILQWWSTHAVLPCVAIGGIKPDNCAPLVEAGADFLAVVTGVWDYPGGPKQAVAHYNQAIALALTGRSC